MPLLTKINIYVNIKQARELRPEYIEREVCKMTYTQMQPTTAKAVKQAAISEFYSLEKRKTTLHDLNMVNSFLNEIERNEVLKIVKLNQHRLSNKQLMDSVRAYTNYQAEYYNIVEIAMILYLCKNIKSLIGKSSYKKAVKAVKKINFFLNQKNKIRTLEKRDVMVSLVFKYL